MIDKSGIRVKIVKSTIHLTFLNGATIILAMFKTYVIALVFGASAQTDAFFIVLFVPQLIDILITPILTYAFIPIFLEVKLNESRYHVELFANTVGTFVLLVCLGLALLFFIFAPQFVSLMAPQFGAPAKQLAVKLFRILAVSQIFLGLSRWRTQILNANKCFATPQLALLSSEIVIILFIFLFHEKLEIYSLIWGLSVGFVLQIFIQVWKSHLNREGFGLAWKFRTPQFKEMLKNGQLILLVWGFSLIPMLAYRILVSKYPNGLSILEYGQRFVSIPMDMVSMSLSIVIFPFLTQNVITKDFSEMKKTVTQSIQLLSFFFIPLLAFINLLGVPILHVLLGGKLFSEEQIQILAEVFAIYSFGIAAIRIESVLSSSFYALKYVYPRVKISAMQHLSNSLLFFLLSKYWGVHGLAIATTIAFLLKLILSVIYLQAKVVVIDWKNLLISISKIVASTLVMIVFLEAWVLLVWHSISGSLHLFVTICLGGTIFCLCSHLSKCQEFYLVRDIIVMYAQRLAKFAK